ncbi:sugar transporter [Ruegeria sp. ANG-R]|uniref:polysaccharide biosynthesis/export family protein n=1 Tax=Ruegeria sp. ANG-R TaxID=1577903 RepID=UPI00057F8F0B|nr:polysaccharide biosynthesis/export family protein [Ruegeria sp. ANG-R]KIC41621.1 sugar transporter [Ruegeria sp. ANG-R]
MKIMLFPGLILAFVLSVASMAWGQANYRVQPGDTLVIEVLEDPSLNRSTTVLPDGNFSFPFAGTLRASGQTVPQIEARIRDAIASNFASAPTVFVAVQPLEPAEDGDLMEIYVVGEVNLPGVVEMDAGSTALQAIAVAGGPSRFAAIKRVQLRRIDPRSGQQSVKTINYKALANGATVSRDILLKDGDVIIVPERRLFE